MRVMPESQRYLAAAPKTLLQNADQLAHRRLVDPVLGDQRFHPELGHRIVRQQSDEFAALDAGHGDVTGNPGDAHAGDRRAQQQLAVVGA